MSEYKLYLDKSNSFQCKLELEGASLDRAHARLVLEGKSRKFLFEGKIYEDGQCDINLEKLNDIFKDGDRGKMTLEVIADDAYFAPWESEFNVDVSRKVRVEVMTPAEAPKKPTMFVSVTTPAEKEYRTVVENVTLKLKANKIDMHNIKNNKTKVTKMVAESIKGTTYNHDVGSLITDIIKNLT